MASKRIFDSLPSHAHTTNTPPTSLARSRDKHMAAKSHLDDVKRNVMVVAELVDILSGEQRYLRRKLERHILTVVGTRGKGCKEGP